MIMPAIQIIENSFMRSLTVFADPTVLSELTSFVPDRKAVPADASYVSDKFASVSWML